MGKYLPNAYQTPNILVDHHLKDGSIDNDQFVILSVLIRETFGWNNFDRHKKISLTRFEEFMPRSSRSTIIRRMQGLHELGLVDIQKEAGKENQYKLSDVFFNPGIMPDQCQADTGGSVTVTPVLKTILNPTKTQLLNPSAPARAAVIASLQKIGFATGDAGELADRYSPEMVDFQLQRLEWGMRFPDWARKVKSRKGWIAGSLKQAAEDGGEGYNIPEGFVSPAAREKAQREREAREAEHQRREAERQAAEAAEAARVAAVNQTYLDFLATLPPPAREEIHRTALELLKADAGGFAWHRYQAGLKLKQKIEEMPAVYPVYLRQVCTTVRARYPDADLPDLPAAEEAV